MKHNRLIANAGSGKTHALTNRMIALLAMDEDPASIAALTFTRKSAGEFLTAVFTRLATAATNPAKLAELQTQTNQPSLDATRCTQLLARLVDRLDRLGMGTIDSLFACIARAFPLESGLADDFTIATTSELEAARDHTLATLFDRKSATDADLDAFLAQFRSIQIKTGERNVFATLQKETANLHQRFLDTPAHATWGDPATIWGPNQPTILPPAPIAPAATALLNAIQLQNPPLNPAALAAWQDDLNLAIQHPPRTHLTSRLAKLLAKLCKTTTPARGGTPYIPTGRTADGRLLLTPTLLPLRNNLRDALLGRHLDSLLARSSSLHRFMGDFDTLHDTLARRTGTITFADITNALAARADDESWRLDVAWRLDQQFDHWLLDEFQDTSRPQWRILKTFIDEVVMDPSERRTFFYVGDTKQAIYSWRGGDPDLFDEIHADYHPAITDAPALDTSYRSCQPVIDLVNTIFGNLGSLADDLHLPDDTLRKWNAAWRTHHTSPKTAALPGHATWTPVPKATDDTNSQDAAVADLLLDSRPWTLGLSCAALKRTNKDATALAAHLRSRNIPVSLEGVSNPCIDNPLGAALLAALRLAASPDDTLSLAIASGFPPATAWQLTTPSTFRRQLLATIATSGFTTAVQELLAPLDLATEPFLRSRAQDFLQAASEFDARRRPQDGLLAFIDFLEKNQTREPEGDGVVRVMTIHQSKGLGFDIVIVSGIDSSSPSNHTNHISLGPSSRSPQWGILMPPKDLAAEEPLLAAESEKLDAARRYEDLCNAYVALTRAKRALHIVSHTIPDNSKATNFGRHLALALGNQPHSAGDPAWFQTNTPAPTPPSHPTTPPPFHPPTTTTPRPTTPSSQPPTHDSTHSSTHTTLTSAATTLGTQVHEALATIEWSDSPSATAASRHANSLLATFLASPLAREVFSRPNPHTTLWRERPFDVLLDGQWFSGIFDRVIIHHTPDGTPSSATIFDFKTDQAPHQTIQSRHATQMSTYQRAAATLLNLPPSQITPRLIPIRP